MEVVVIGAHVGPDDIRGLAAMPVGKDAREFEAEDLHEEERRDQSHDILACLLTVYAFVLIFALEKLASLEATGPKADQAIYTVMGSLGILVGFTWEQAFERSVSTVVQANPAAPEPVLKAGLALFLVGMVLPAWRMYIILHTMKHSTEHMAEDDYEHGKKLPLPPAKPDHQEQAILEKHGAAEQAEQAA